MAHIDPLTGQMVPDAGDAPDTTLANYLAQLKALTGEMGPSASDKEQAKWNGVLTGGLAFMGARKGHELEAAGNAGIMGLNANNQELQRLQQQRVSNLAQAAAVNKLMQQQQAAQGWSDLFKRGNQMAPDKGVQPFPAPGGASASALMKGASFSAGAPDLTAEPGTGAPQFTSQLNLGAATGLPTMAPAKNTMNFRQEAAMRNLIGMANDQKDMSPGLNFMFKDPVSMRPNAFGVDPTTGAAKHYPVASPGHTIMTDANGDFYEVPLNGGPDAVARSVATSELAKKYSEPMYTVNERGDKVLTQGLSQGSALGMNADQVARLVTGRPGAPSATTHGDSVVGTQPATPGAAGQSAQSTQDWYNGLPPAGPAPVQFTTELGPSRHAELADQGKNYAASAQQVDTNGNIATAGRARVQTMLAFLPAFEPGASSALRMAAAAWIGPGGLGGSQELANRVAGGDLSAMQEFQKLAFGGSIEGLRAMLGPNQQIRQLEMLTNAQNSPNVALQRRANEQMLHFADDTFRWQQEKQQEWSKWDQAGKSYRNFDATWNREHPLSAYVQSPEAIQKALDASKPTAPPAPKGGTSGVIGGGAQPNAAPPVDEEGLPKNINPAVANNQTAKAYIKSVIKGGDARKILELYNLHYLTQ